MLQIRLILLLMLFCSNTTVASQWKRVMIGDQIVVRVEIATSTQEQMLGLGGRDSLPDGTGMLFVYNKVGERVFWMKRMRIPIDIVWIRKNQIIHIEHRVPPPSPLTNDRSLKRYGRGIFADMVLELPDGYTSTHSILPGQTVRLTH